MKCWFLLVCFLAACASTEPDMDRIPPDGFERRFDVDRGDLSSTGTSTYLVLLPGTVSVLEGRDLPVLNTGPRPELDDGHRWNSRLTIRVLDETKWIDGVETRVVEARETLDEWLIGVRRRYLAVCKRTLDVYCLGEDVVSNKHTLVSRAGTWRAGSRGARFGLEMVAAPLEGRRFYREVAPEVALDRVEIIDTDAVFVAGNRRFEHCVTVRVTTPLQPGRERLETYAPGVGLVSAGQMVLAVDAAGPRRD